MNPDLEADLQSELKTDAGEVVPLIHRIHNLEQKVKELERVYGMLVGDGR